MDHRIKFKCNVFVYRMLKLKEECPPYLEGIFITKTFSCNTRGSSDIFILDDKDPNGNKFYRNSIAARMVINWNSLPSELRHLENFEQFQRDLKTYYFKKWLIEKGI